MASKGKKPPKGHGAKRAHDRSFCGAKTRAGGKCKRPAGWGTDHTGSGRCKLHGGRNKGKKGNDNAVKHGLTRKDVTGKAPGLRLVRPDRQDVLDSELDALRSQTDAEVFLEGSRERIAYLRHCLIENERIYSEVVSQAVSRDIESTRESKTTEGKSEQKQKLTVDQGRVRERYERNRISLTRRIDEETRLFLDAVEKCRALGLIQEEKEDAVFRMALDGDSAFVVPIGKGIDLVEAYHAAKDKGGD